ncbi:MAG: enoyl-CoA hydratase [Deltaproteobacteria bacterium]|jgi:enoyl-CoA hydratase|nr:enoyl-CoA hydratase [Deltaproteobacteria bacterium]
MPRNYTAYEANLRIGYEDRILTVTLHNPERMNANTPEMHAALSTVWDEINDDPEVQLVILTAAGERAFSAGGDPVMMERMIEEKEHWWQTVPEARRIVFRMLECEKPIIARVQGHAVGFGATLALCADLIVAVETAKFGDPHVQAGLACGDGGALLWAQHVGYAKAKEFLFTGDLLTAREAAEIGLINHAVPREELDAKVDELARKILSGAPQAIRLTKNVMNLPLRQAAHATMDLGMANETISTYSEDHRAAVKAMQKKETPRFTGK